MTTITLNHHVDTSISFSRFLKRLGAQLRRALELSGKPYADGPYAPL